MQLARACLAAGYDFIAPVSWGEEIVAVQVTRELERRGGGVAILSSCPFVRESLREAGVGQATIRTVPGPVACARYLRTMFRPRLVRVTYIGACPGAASTEVDELLLPEVLLERLVIGGIDLLSQPRVYDTRLPPERARYASRPGGAPDSGWLGEQNALLVEAVPVTVEAVAAMHAQESVLIDLAAASRCRCACDSAAIARLEPPRALLPVVRDLGVPVADEPVRAPFEREVPQHIDVEPVVLPGQPPVLERERRARFAEFGLV